MNEMEIFKEFRIEAAHRLPNVPASHKCSRLHGHSFRVVVHVAGPIDPVQGWVCDFADITSADGITTAVSAPILHRQSSDSFSQKLYRRPTR